MIERADIIESLREELRLLKPKLPAAWHPAARYGAELGLDSLDVVEFVARLEIRFGILIPDEDVREFTSLDTTADYLLSHRRA